MLPALSRAEEAELRWTNTVRLSTSYQFNEVPPLADNRCWSGINCGYGSDFTQGRADWLSELDIERGGWALKASLEARKDRVEPDSSYFQLHEANLHGAIDLAGRPLSLSLGRQSVIWGESLTFAGNGIAGAQAPVDATYGFGTEGYAASAHFLPVAQISANWQLADRVTLLAYQQFEWRRNRIDPEDPYAPAGDVLGDPYLKRIALYFPKYGPISYDHVAGRTPSGLDQFGVGINLRQNEWDIGLYALEFDAKTPALVYYRDEVRTYSLNYARAIGLVGASLAGSVGEAAVGAELSMRRHMPLTDGGIFLYEGGDGGEAGPRGNTVHGQISLTLPIEPSPLLPGGATWTSEIAANHLAVVTANPDRLSPGRTRDAAALRSTLVLQFYQVVPRLDLSVPVSLGYGIAGYSSVIPEMNRASGDISIGVTATFDTAWTAGFIVTHYFGSDDLPIPGYAGRLLSEWDKISATLQYSF